jgi:hypothetical protein
MGRIMIEPIGRKNGRDVAKRFGLSCVFLILIFFVALTWSAFAASTLPSGIENPLTIRYPELALAPAPEWLEEGTRATYYVLSGTSDSQRDENREYGTGSSGYGLSQTDVVALEHGKAATFIQSYAPDVQGAFRPLVGIGSVDVPGCGDFWCNPDVLRNIPERASNDLTVQKIPLTLSNKVYDTIRFDFKVDYSSYNLNDNYLARSGNHASYEIHNLRNVQIPWIDGQVPSWLATGDTLSYQGQKVVQVQGAQPYSFVLSVQGRAAFVHNRFAEMQLSVYSQDAATPSDTAIVSGIGQLLGFWIPKDAMTDLRPGIVDWDPDTKMQVSIVQSDDRGAIFEKTNQQDYRAQFAYDASGKLVQMVTEYNPDVMTTTGFGSVRTESLQLVS